MPSPPGWLASRAVVTRSLRISVNTLSVGAGNEGIRTYLVELVAALARMDSPHRFRLICTQDNVEFFAGCETSVERLVLPRRWPAVLSRLWRDQLTIPWLARRGTDVLFTPSSVGSVLAPVRQIVAVPAHLAFASVRRGLPGPTLSWIHRIYYGPVMRLSHRRAVAVTPISEFLSRRLVEENGMPAAKVTMVPCGVSPAPERRADDDSLWSPVALFVGTLYPYKNAVALLEAAALARDRLPVGFRVVIAGRDPDGRQLTRLRARARTLDLMQMVELTGPVDSERLERLYRGAGMLVFPSLAEGFGLPVLEAMARGVPVVAADRGALPEVVGDAGLLFDPDEWSELADAMVAVSIDPILRRRLVSAGRQRALGFSWDRSARAFVDLFERIVP